MKQNLILPQTFRQRLLMDRNPDLKHLNSLLDQIEYNANEILKMQREMAQHEIEFECFKKDHFVLLAQVETFQNHMNEVSYPMGYYETVEAAQKEALQDDAFEFGWKIYDLNGQLCDKGDWASHYEKLDKLEGSK